MILVDYNQVAISNLMEQIGKITKVVNPDFKIFVGYLFTGDLRVNNNPEKFFRYFIKWKKYKNTLLQLDTIIDQEFDWDQSRILDDVHQETIGVTVVINFMFIDNIHLQDIAEPVYYS